MPDSPILLDLPANLYGQRVAVRPWQAGDGVALYEAIRESVDHFHPWLPSSHHDSPESSECMAREFHARWMLREDSPWAIWSRDDTRLIGGTGLHRIDWGVRSFEIGYWVRASEHGKGYVTEAVGLITALCFDHLSANRVFIRCAVENQRSSAVPRRLGFVHEGVLRNNAKDVEGNLHDMDIFSMIPEDYQKASWRSK